MRKHDAHRQRKREKSLMQHRNCCLVQKESPYESKWEQICRDKCLTFQYICLSRSLHDQIY